MEYVTVEGVEIISAGMNWRGGSAYYVTAEHLADMVAASRDPLVRRPRAKLGHFGELFQTLVGMHDPTYDFDDEPAFGSYENLRLADAGTVLVGDQVETPAWLADGMPSAYPTRSAEWVWDWTTAGRNTYSAVLTDVALGGVWEPAVEDLQDITREQATAALAALLAEGPDAAIAALTPTEEAAVAGSTKKPATASVSTDRIVSAFYEWAEDQDVLGYWPWLRDIRVDPDEVIATNEETGSTYRCPWTTDGEVAVTFDEPVEVRDTYIDVASPAAATAAAGARTSQRVLATDFPRPERPVRPNPAASRPDNEENAMDPQVLKALAAAHGLDPDTATEEQVNAAALAATQEPPVTPPVTPPAPSAATEVEPAPAEPPAPVVDTPVVDVDAELEEAERKRIADLEAEVKELREERETRELAVASQRRDKVIADALASGRMTKDEADETYRPLLDVPGAEEKVAARIAGMTAGRVPVDGRRSKPATATATQDGDALYRAACARMGITPTIRQEA